MHFFESNTTRLTVSEAGCLTSLQNRLTGTDYAGGGALWRMYLQREDEHDIEVLAADTKPSISQKDDRITLRWPAVRCRGATLAIEAVVTVRLDGDESRWSIAIRNKQADVTVHEVHFPSIYALKLKPGQALLWSHAGGQRIADVRAEILKQHSFWAGKDHLVIPRFLGYPGRTAATNCFEFADDTEGLYFGLHSPIRDDTEHMLGLWRYRDLDACFVRYAHCGCGQAWEQDGYVVSPYSGSWHVGADKYRKWANTWWAPPAPPAWVRSMSGWQRIIMKHQYGEVNYRFDQLPQIRGDGSRAGVDALFMFGWHRGGHDNDYPNYVPAERLGGEAQLVEQVRRFHQDGGRVLLYFNGHIMDVESDFYREHGQASSLKNMRGLEWRENWEFRGNGCYYNLSGGRVFAVACASSSKWFAQLKAMADRACDYGCDSVFYDQMGFRDPFCGDPKHGHPVPWHGSGEAKAHLIRDLRAHIRRRNPEMAIGVEWVNDMMAQYADFFHGNSCGCTAENDWAASGEKPRTQGFLEWFRYIFPEVILSNREIRDDSDIERRINHALLLGLRNDVEVYRCRRSIAEAPHYQAYLGQVNALRARHADLLLQGHYCDTRGFEHDNPEIDAKAFVQGRRMAILLTQSHRESEAAVVRAAGYRLCGHDHAGVAAVSEKSGQAHARIGRHGLLVMLYEKE